jgi:hypothetical protein
MNIITSLSICANSDCFIIKDCSFITFINTVTLAVNHGERSCLRDGCEPHHRTILY